MNDHHPQAGSTKPVALVIGASRGIGRQIAIDLAKAKYRVVVSGKSLSDSSTDTSFPPDPNSASSTITTVTREIAQAGGVASAIPVDVRSPESIEGLVQNTIEKYGQLDVVIYNAGAIWWSSVEKTNMKRFKLMQSVNPEGLYATLQACFPCFSRNNWHGRVIAVCPPIYSRFFRGKTAYAMGKVGMSVLVKGLAMDFDREGKRGMAITGIWPATAVESAATKRIADAVPAEKRDLRRATIFSDAVLAILQADTEVINGQLLLDEDFLRAHCGMTDFSQYSVVKGAVPRRIMPATFPSLLVDEQDDEGRRVDSTQLGRAKL